MLHPTARGSPDNRPTPSLWTFAAASILLWVVLPFTQDEQRRAWQINRMLAEQRIAEALATMSATPRDRLPPHFDPHPRHWHGKTTPELLDVLDVVVDESPAPWVRGLYLQKLALRLEWPRQVDWDRVASLLARLPEGPELAARVPENYRWRLDPVSLPPDKGVSPLRP